MCQKSREETFWFFCFPFHAASVCLKDSILVKQYPSCSLGKEQTNECLCSSAIVPHEQSISHCSCVLRLAPFPCCPRRTNDMRVGKVNRDICSCPFLTNTISYSVTGTVWILTMSQSQREKVWEVALVWSMEEGSCDSNTAHWSAGMISLFPS